MKKQLSAELEVAASVEEVYDFWNNIENVPLWLPLVKEIKRLSHKEEVLHWKLGFGFPLITEWTSHITQCIPHQLIAWESISGLLNQGSAEFFPTEKGCRIRLCLSFDVPSGIIATFLDNIGIDRWLQTNLEESLHRFQCLLEKDILSNKK
jgi:uncharacterized membrane protein